MIKKEFLWESGINNMSRSLNSYEYNFLNKHGIKDAFSYGEMPVEYIVGLAEFFNREFIVSSDVLIPRIETEEIISLVLKSISNNQLFRIADIGTGSGIIGITLYLELKKLEVKSKIYLSDISLDVLDVTKKNVKKLIGFSENVRILQSDLLYAYPRDIKFDFIIANLPYIPSERIYDLEDSVKNYEPILALDGGEDGMYLIKHLLGQVKEFDYLEKNGKIILEIDDTHDLKTFEEFINDYNVEILKDQFDRNRFVILEAI